MRKVRRSKAVGHCIQGMNGLLQNGGSMLESEVIKNTDSSQETATAEKTDHLFIVRAQNRRVLLAMERLDVIAPHRAANDQVVRHAQPATFRAWKRCVKSFDVNAFDMRCKFRPADVLNATEKAGVFPLTLTLSRRAWIVEHLNFVTSTVLVL